MRQPIAVWNSVRDVWEVPGTANLLCEHLDVFSGTLPISGSMRNGSVFEHPMSGRRMGGSVFSLLPTPKASDGESGTPSTSGRPVERSTSLPTQVMLMSGNLEHRHLPSGAQLLPTPSACNANDGESFDSWEARRQRVRLTANNGNGMGIPLAIAVQTVPPTDWGKFAAAIERWETVMGSAPSAVQPSATGKPQLAPRFVEWMMGLGQGWATGHGLTRNQELRMLGNGVVPQQAFAALSAAVGRF